MRKRAMSPVEACHPTTTSPGGAKEAPPHRPPLRPTGPGTLILSRPPPPAHPSPLGYNTTVPPHPAQPPDAWQPCSLCQRLVPPELITLHHLTPREKGGKAEHRVPLCKPCHKQLHAIFSNKQLAQRYDSIESLRAAPELQTYLAWIRKQKAGRNFRTRPSATHPRSRRRY